MKINPVCERMKTVRISGDVIPASWYQNIRKGKNKTDLVACAILANIMYWYRPTEVRDEATDKVIGYKQKFKADKLQKSYANYAEMLGIPKSTIKKAIDNLVNLKLVTRTFRNFTTKEGLRLINVMYLEPILDNILAISYTTSPTNCKGRNTGFVDEVNNKKEGTNTSSTTENTTATTTVKESSTSVADNATDENNPSLDRKKKIEKYIPLAKKLADIITTNKKVKITNRKITSWANEIRRLIETDGVGYERVEEALSWYEANIGGEYIPVVESGHTLRTKFLKLEEAMIRKGDKEREDPHDAEYYRKKYHYSVIKI